MEHERCCRWCFPTQRRRLWPSMHSRPAGKLGCPPLCQAKMQLSHGTLCFHELRRTLTPKHWWFGSLRAKWQYDFSRTIEWLQVKRNSSQSHILQERGQRNLLFLLDYFENRFLQYQFRTLGGLRTLAAFGNIPMERSTSSVDAGEEFFSSFNLS